MSKAGGMQWFRLYSRIVDDDKLKLLAFEDRWHFVAICCLQSEGLLSEPDSDLRTRRIAVRLGVQVRELDEISRRLREVNLVDETLHPIAWDDLQFRSDTSSDRVKRYREKRKSNGLPAGSEAYLKHYAALMERDAGACIYCRAKENLCVDHMVPVAQGGTDEFDNLAIACKACNSGKAGRTPKQAGYKILCKQAAIALSRYVTVTVTPQETETETEVSPKGDCTSGDALTDSHVFEGYQDLARELGLPIPRDLTPERRQLVKARRAQYPLADFLTVFARCRGSPFLRGERGGRTPLTFDWLMQKKNFQKVLEGNYDG